MMDKVYPLRASDKAIESLGIAKTRTQVFLFITLWQNQ